MGKIIMTGVDGNFGGFAARSIMKKVPFENLIFTAPNLKTLEQYANQGVETRRADFNDPAQLKEAFEGGEVLLLISMPFVGEKRRNAHKNAIDAAVAAGVKKVIYTSIVGSGDDTCESYEKVDHQYTENYIFSTDLKYVILRDSQYCEAMISAFEDAANKDGIVATNMGDGRMAYIARNDCAEAAACAAAGAGEDNKIYYISGPEALTIDEFVKIGAEVTGKKVAYSFIDDDEMYKFFDSIGVPRYTDGEWAESAKAFPFCSTGMVTFGAAIRKDQMSFCTNDFEMLTGKKPMSVRQMFEDLENHRIGTRTSTD
ncbi:NmrA family NAD(P)-binding protein [Clostridium sp. A1-XYC3]|uniref:NmrA family NAD(P)-binding protein n=1 Tax=Clostridium tanneri TaxID=3037988 RepID=A0ABU4JY74_9CLOT|nr:NmrA family NAD(P)-binding protein [Clostridium sp. A1-XYC3]MDW8803126.1 NmrA family NAD(P)-binding protein [Clostridium sp. A1-XYC3]